MSAAGRERPLSATNSFALLGAVCYAMCWPKQVMFYFAGGGGEMLRKGSGIKI